MRRLQELLQHVQSVGCVVDEINSLVLYDNQSEERSRSRGTSAAVDQLMVDLRARWSDLNDVAVVAVHDAEIPIGSERESKRIVKESTCRTVTPVDALVVRTRAS